MLREINTTKIIHRVLFSLQKHCGRAAIPQQDAPCEGRYQLELRHVGRLREEQGLSPAHRQHLRARPDPVIGLQHLPLQLGADEAELGGGSAWIAEPPAVLGR